MSLGQWDFQVGLGQSSAPESPLGAVYDTPKGGLLCGKLFCLGSCCGTGQTEFLQPSINKTLDHFFSAPQTH